MKFIKIIYILLFSFGVSFTSYSQTIMPRDHVAITQKVKQDTTEKEVKEKRKRNDTLSISQVTALSFVAPGFSQYYNKQYWKAPVMYAAVGTFTGLGLISRNHYKKYKTLYNNAVASGNNDRDLIDYRLKKKTRYQNQTTLLFGAAALTYIYFVADGVMNYPHYTDKVRKATTLSTIFPGAGQMYNKSYWKLPIVWGGFATMGYIIDFNQRGYDRFKQAYRWATDDNPETNNELTGYPSELLKNTRNMYRRNRDYSIIITGLFYALNVIDAQVDAYMKDFDVSDDLAIKVEPSILDISGSSYAMRNNKAYGMTMKLNF